MPEKTYRNLAFPTSIPIDTTSHCNLKCSMCTHKNMTRPKGRMEAALFKKIIDEISIINKKTRIWPVFFGEALLLKKTKPSIFEMISYAKKKGLEDVSLNTNACLLDKDSCIKLLDSGLDSIHIGLDAISENTYNKIRIGGDYNKVVNNVLTLIDLANNKKRNPLKIRVQFIEMEENIKERDEFIKYWKNKNVDIKIRKKISWCGGINSKSTDNFYRHPCYWILNTLAITHDGNVTTCPADPNAKYVAGNVLTQSISDIWNGTLKKIREIHLNNEWELLPEPCKSCPDWIYSYEDSILSKKNRTNYLVKILDVLGIKKHGKDTL
ncbi:MAG: SPASM domain-containing protein [Candidatus Atribacteria bacterium]|nr:SPASM domain-containing protein [Candidatus Atribacteria bacterium]